MKNDKIDIEELNETTMIYFEHSTIIDYWATPFAVNSVIVK